MIWNVARGIGKVFLFLVWLVLASATQSATFFYTTEYSEDEFPLILDQELFDLGRQSMPLLGENQEETLTPAVFPGIPNGSFTEGTDVGLGLTFQSNANKANPALPHPGGNLVLIGPVPGVSFGRIGPADPADSLDIITEPPLYPSVIWAMSFAVRAGVENDAPVTLRLYDNAGSLLGMTNFPAGAEKVGFLLDANGLLRVNLSSDDYVEVGEVRLYSKVGPPDAFASTLFPSSPISFLDVPVEITVSVSDERGQLRDMGGDDVLITSTPGSALSTVIDQEDGTYTAMLSRFQPGSTTVHAYLGTTIMDPLVGEIEVDFTSGRAAAITSYNLDDEVISFIGGTTTARVSLVDSFGNVPPEGVTVRFASSDTNRAAVVAESLSASNGVAVVTVTGGTHVGAVDISASIDSGDSNVASNDVRVASLLVRDPDATATITGWEAQDRPYDRTTNVVVLGEAELTGILPEHDVELTGDPTFYFRDPTVGENRRVDILGVELSGPDAGLYTLVLPVLTANITPVQLAVVNAVALDKPFDTTTEAEIAGTELSGVLAGDDVVLVDADIGTFAQSDIGENIVVQTFMSLAGADAANYTLEQPLLTASIFASPNLFLRSDSPEGPEFEQFSELFFIGMQSMPDMAAGDFESVGASVVQPNVSAGAFLNGTDPVAGITLRSNAGTEDTSETILGSNLILIGPDEEGGFSWIGLDERLNSLDVVMEPPGSVGLVSGLSMAVRTAQGDAPIRVRLYDGAGLIGEHVYPADTQRIGILTSQTGWLRLNVYAEGADVELGEIRIYSSVGPADPVMSTLERLSAQPVYGDQAAEFRVTIRDENGSVREQGGEDVYFTATLGTLVMPADYFDGTYGIQLQFTNDTVATSVVRAYLGTAPNPAHEIGEVSVDFVAGRAAEMSNVGLADFIINMNVGTTIVSGRVVNVRGNPPPAGVRVLLSSSEPLTASVVSEVFTDATGSFEAAISAGAQPGATLITIALDAEDADVAVSSEIEVELLVRDPDWTAMITGWIAEDRIYDRTTNAVVVGEASLTGVDPAHDVILTGVAQFHFATRQAGEGKRIFISGLSLDGDDAELYTLELPILHASILPAELTVIGATVLDKPFDGNTDAVIVSASLAGAFPEDDVQLVNADMGWFADANIGEAIEVLTAMDLAGADAGNYTLIQPSLVADIFFTPVVFLRSTTETGDEFDIIAELNFIGRQEIPAEDIFLASPSVFPGQPIGPFTNGTDAAFGITLQSHANALETSAPVPGDNLVVVDDGFGRIGPSTRANSFDMIMQPVGFVGLVQGVSLAARSTGGDSTIRVRAYDNDELMGEYVFPAGTQRIGIRTYVRGLIRLNFYAPTGDLEIGDIRLYSALGPPAGGPSTLTRLTPQPLYADELAEFEVVVRDAAGEIRDLGGDDVLYAASEGSFVQHRDFANGIYRVKLNYTNNYPTTITVRAHVGTSTEDPLVGEVTADFLPARAGLLANFQADEPLLIRHTSTVARLNVQSIYGQSRENVRVQVSSGDTNIVSLSDNELLSASDGEITFTLSAGIEGATTIVASMDGNDENVMADLEQSLPVAVVVQTVVFEQTNGQVRLQWTTIPTREYTVQRATRLTGSPTFTNWVTRVADVDFDELEDDLESETLFYRVLPTGN